MTENEKKRHMHSLLINTLQVEDTGFSVELIKMRTMSKLPQVFVCIRSYVVDLYGCTYHK